MNQVDETDALLPEWLAEHTAVIRQLSRTDIGLYELLGDHALLTKAIRYWSGKSDERVEKFRFLAKELQHEIACLCCRLYDHQGGDSDDR